MAKQDKQEPQERKRGEDALPQVVKDQLRQQPGEPADVARGPEVAGDFPEEATKGSVLPYKVDDIDVDSFDVRTPQEIQDQKDAEAAEEDDANE